MRRRRGQRGFTLIELLIVVGIMGVLTAGVVPLVLGTLKKAPQPPPARELTLAALSVRGGERPLPIESSDVRVRLGAAPVLDGLRVHTRYQADFRGAFVIRNDGPARRLTLELPFPPGMTEARDARLEVRDESGAAPRESATRYRQEGMAWEGEVEAGARIVATVAYQAEGRDAFVYAVTGPGRSGRIKFEVDAPAGTRLELDPGSLAPTAAGPNHMEFLYDRLITQKPVAVRLPPGPSPLGRVILLCQLGGLSVLLFGAGFWYLSERRRPGALDDFRWGHFLLLALNHGLFFALFAVLGYDGRPLEALFVAAGVSLALLTVHVARTFDRRFALARALPLSALTLGAAAAGAYLEAQRPCLLVGLVALVVGYVTLTYRDWSAGRLEHERARAKRRERDEKLDELNRRWGQVRAALDEIRSAAQSAVEAELLAGPGERPERERLAERRARADAEGAKAAVLERELRDLEPLDDLTGDVIRELELSLKLALPRLERAKEALTAALEALRAATEREALRLRHGEGAGRHCTGCGAHLAAPASFCQGCGLRAPELVPCQGCGHDLIVPGQWSALTKGPLRCHGCGVELPRAAVKAPAALRPACGVG